MIQPPKLRRRWKRRTALALVLAIACGVWVVSGESETLRRARRLKPGMTVAQVEAVMGQPMHRLFTQPSGSAEPHTISCRYATPSESQLYRFRLQLCRYARAMGFEDLSGIPDLPVVVEFDDNGQTAYIRRGSEVVER
jgi:hypothetical protein